MAITLQVTDGYCTLTEADTYNENNADWSVMTDEAKQDAILGARYYIDTHFSCDLTSYDVIPDELKYANAILATDYGADSTVFDAKPMVKRLKQKADVLESEVEYVSGSSSKPKSLMIAEGALKDLCSKSGGAAVFLQRA